MNIFIAAILLFTIALVILAAMAIALFLCIWGGSWIFYAVVEWIDRTFKFPPI